MQADIISASVAAVCQLRDGSEKGPANFLPSIADVLCKLAALATLQHSPSSAHLLNLAAKTVMFVEDVMLVPPPDSRPFEAQKPQGTSSPTVMGTKAEIWDTTLNKSDEGYWAEKKPEKEEIRPSSTEIEMWE